MDITRARVGWYGSTLVATFSMLLAAPPPAAAQALSFTGPTFVAAGDYPEQVAVGDLNGDGFLDLAVANVGSGDVSILLGRGDGTFGSQTRYAASNAFAVAVADLNGDSRLDLVVADTGSSCTSPGGALVRLGNGNGTFQSAVSYAAGCGPLGVAVADFDEDGKLDLAVSNTGADNVSILLGNGNGTFQTPLNSTAPAEASRSSSRAQRPRSATSPTPSAT